MKKKLFVLCLSLIMVLSLAPAAIFAEQATSQSLTSAKIERPLPSSPLKPGLGKALTPPPPTEMTTQSLIDPSLKYILQAYAYIGVQSNNKLNISANVLATQEVDQINIQLTLERWNGSAWLTQYSSPTYKAAEVTVYGTGVSDLGPLSGYYYRTKAYIYVREGVHAESVTKYTHYILAP